MARARKNPEAHQNPAQNQAQAQVHDVWKYSTLHPRNARQRAYMHSILQNTITIASGPPGVAKTLLPLYLGFELLSKDRIERIVYIKPDVGMVGQRGRGYLPGSALEKAWPLIGPILDNLVVFMPRHTAMYHLERKNIEVMLMEDLRGRSLNNCLALFDECFPEGTEILTSGGFLDFRELTTDDEVAAYAPDGSISWEQPSRIIAKEYDGTVRTLFDYTVTENHNRVFRDNRGGLVLRKASEGFEPGDKLPLYREADIPLDDATDEQEHYRGMVYCCTVSTGMIVIRQKGKVFVSGNCQNISPGDVKTILTRTGEGAHMILCGDPGQCDTRPDPNGIYTNGLADALIRLQGLTDVGIVEFTRADIVRNGVIPDILARYD